MRILRWFTAIIIILSMGAFSSQAASLSDFGVLTLTTIVPERGRAIDITLWYPANQDGTPELFGDSKIFNGIPVRRKASLADGRFPIILLAHGGLRANPMLAGWIAAYLASRGNVVVMVHPPKLDENDARSAIDEISLRPTDLSAALNAVETDPDLSPHLDQEKVAAVGFFLGGTSVLALAGAELDAEAYKRSCDEPTIDPDCHWFAKSRIDLHEIDGVSISGSHRDPRIKVAVAVNPELTTSFTGKSLRAIAVPVQVIALGKVDPDQSRLDRAVPNVRYAEIADATPFSAFSPCMPKATAILAEEGEDGSICRDGTDRPREEIQAQMGAIIETALADGFHERP